MSSPVQVKEQVNLPLSKCMELVTSGIQYRLFRAAITVTIIALAVAFLMVMLSQSLITRQVGQAVEQRTAPRKLFDKWVSRLGAPIGEAELTADLAVLAGPADPRWQEFRDWGKLTDDQMKALQQIAVQETDCLDNFFSKLSEGKRRQFVGSASGVEIFACLAQQGQLPKFQEHLKDSDRKLPMTFDMFQTLMADWSRTRRDREAIIRGHKAALEPVKAAMGDKQAVDALATADAPFLDMLKANGFHMTEDQLTLVRREATLAVDARKITDLLKVPLLRQNVADKANVVLARADIDLLFDQISSRSGARWLAELSAKEDFVTAARQMSISPLNFTGGPLVDPTDVKKYPRHEVTKTGRDGKKNTTIEMTAEAKAQFDRDVAPFIETNAARVYEVVTDRLARQELSEIEAAVMQSGGSTGFSSRTVWLIIVSFLVCVVGIANAMLMSVTERFREIATMKCLGATDSFIMINFILESIMQGVAGGVVGAILGFILGTLKAWITYGNMAWHNFPWGAVSATAGVALVVGVVVSALAAVYPAYVAARLAPMEAMRIE